MPKTTKPPAYRLYKRTGQAVVTLGGQDHYLGPHDTKTSRDAYDRLVGEWMTNGRRLPQGGGATVSVSELMAAYLGFATGYYRKGGQPTKEIFHIRRMMSFLKPQYGQRLVTDFGPLALKAVRGQLVTAGQSRTYVNDTVGRVKRMFRWGVENELVPATVYHALQAVAGLKWGRCEARESEPVRPVPDQFVDAIQPHVSRQIWAIVQLQRLTGMRPGEVLAMRGRDLDTTGQIWLYQPGSHKTQHRGHDRIVELGPRAQVVIRPFLKPDLDAFLFSPRDATAERRQALQAKRKTPVSCGNRAGTNRKRRPKRSAGDRYSTDSYRQAVQRACDLADRRAKEQKGLDLDSERVVPRWHPHQLRHNYGTRVRKQYGIETARILLGHRSTNATEIYAETDRSKAREIVGKIG